MGLGLGLRSKFERLKSEAGILLANAFTKPSSSIKSIYFSPSDMCEPDRVMLYALVRGLRPERVLEVGARWGGGARIISAALQESGFGKAIGIDPEPKNFRPSPEDLHHRYELMAGYSPQDVPAAVAKLGGKIDFAFIDAMHTHDHVFADFNAVIPHMAAGGHVLLHDTFHVGINTAIEKVLQANPAFSDCGFLTRYPSLMDNAPVAYEGLRLIRISTPPHHDTMRASYRLMGGDASLDPELINWDHHWNRIKSSADA
jgi:cephalosporin hydroxylase